MKRILTRNRLNLAQNSTPPTQSLNKGEVLDWSATPLAGDYQGYYVKIIDDLYTDEECAELIALAESDNRWEQAAVNYGLQPHENYVNLDYRNSERILRFDNAAADKIYQKLLPYIGEFLEIQPGDEWEGIIAKPGKVQGTWKCVGVNERLSFLRYGKGHYFRDHCDGQIELPDGREARVTLQIYLGEEGVKGGATRIWGGRKRYYDVEPKKGRVLLFQQRGILHSGEEVEKGIKYALRSDFMFCHS